MLELGREPREGGPAPAALAALHVLDERIGGTPCHFGGRGGRAVRVDAKSSGVPALTRPLFDARDAVELSTQRSERAAAAFEREFGPPYIMTTYNRKYGYLVSRRLGSEREGAF